MEFDYQNLSRNYKENPLKAKELIPIEDLKYLYMDLNLCFEEMSAILGKSANSISKQCRKAKLIKDKQTHKEALKQYFIKTLGVENPAQLNSSRQKQKQTWKNKNTKDIIEKRKKTCLQKYNCDNPAKNKQIKEKIKQTNLQKFGVEYPSQLKHIQEKQKQTMKDKYSCEYALQNKEIRDKQEQTCLNRYGVSNAFQNKDIQNKQKQTCLNKYNVDNGAKTDFSKQHYKETCLQKYGVDNTFKVPEFRKKAIHTLNIKYNVDNISHNQQIKQKKIQTLLEHYGVDNAFKSTEIQEKIKQTYNQKYNVTNPMQIKELQLKAFNTKKKNGSFGTSKTESIILQKLQTLFPDVITQYHSEQYPYPCDFYIPSLDLYIEYQGFMTHGDSPFDKNNPEHIKILKELTQKAQEMNFKGQKKLMYQNAIKVWTITDPHKRQLVKDNNLNWLEFFTLQQFETWFKEVQDLWK